MEKERKNPCSGETSLQTANKNTSHLQPSSETGRTLYRESRWSFLAKQSAFTTFRQTVFALQHAKVGSLSTEDGQNCPIM